VSRFEAAPVDIMAHLMSVFTPESVLGFQQAIGKKAMMEAARGLTYTADYMSTQDEYYEGYVAATQAIDPADVYCTESYPGEIVTFE